MEEHERISPELALVDPELRARALDELARVEATRVWSPYAPVRLNRPEILPPARRRHVPLPVAAVVYLGMGMVQVAVWGLVLVAALVISITAAVLFG